MNPVDSHVLAKCPSLKSDRDLVSATPRLETLQILCHIFYIFGTILFFWERGDGWLAGNEKKNRAGQEEGPPSGGGGSWDKEGAVFMCTFY